MILKYEDIYPKLVLTGTYIADPKVVDVLIKVLVWSSDMVPRKRPLPYIWILSLFFARIDLLCRKPASD